MDLLRRVFDRSVELANQDYEGRQELNNLLTESMLRSYVDTKSEVADTLTDMQKYEIQAKIQALVDAAQNLLTAFNEGNFDINESRNVIKEYNNFSLYLNSEIKYYSLSQREQNQIAVEMEVLMPIMEELALVAEARKQTTIGNAYQNIYDKLRFKDFTPMKLSKDAVASLKDKQELFKQMKKWLDEYFTLYEQMTEAGASVGYASYRGIPGNEADDKRFMSVIRKRINTYALLRTAAEKEEEVQFIAESKAIVKEILGKMLQMVAQFNQIALGSRRAEAVIDLPKADDVIEDEAQREVYEKIREDTMKAEQAAREAEQEALRLDALAKQREEERQLEEEDAVKRKQAAMETTRKKLEDVEKAVKAKKETVKKMDQKKRALIAERKAAGNTYEAVEKQFNDIRAALATARTPAEQERLNEELQKKEDDMLRLTPTIAQLDKEIQTYTRSYKAHETMMKKKVEERNALRRELGAPFTPSPAKPSVMSTVAKAATNAAVTAASTVASKARRTLDMMNPFSESAAAPAPLSFETPAKEPDGVEESKAAEAPAAAPVFSPDIGAAVDNIEFNGKRRKPTKGGGKKKATTKAATTTKATHKPKTAWMQLVEKVRKETGLKLKDALAYIKKNNLYKK